MSHQLWLKLPRTIVAERGFGLTHHPADVVKRLAGTFDLDPLTGCACCPVLLDYSEPLDLGLTGDDDWSERAPWCDANGTFPGGFWEHTAELPFTVTTADELDDGEGFYLGFILWPTTPVLSVRFGSGCELHLEDGTATLLQDGADRGAATLWDREEWTGQLHHLYVYNVGRRFCLRRLGPNAEAGLTVLDKVAEAEDRLYSLRADTITVSGEGMCCLGLARERHEKTLELEHELVRLAQPLTSAPETEAVFVPTTEPSDAEDYVDPDAPEIELLDADGEVIVEDDEPTYDEFGYRVSAELASATGPNLYVNHITVAWPEVVVSDGLTGTDLNAVSGVALESVEEQLNLDGSGSTLTFVAKAARGVLSGWVQGNMSVEWWPDGQPRFRGLTTAPECSFQLATETVRIQCDSLWKRFRTTRWGGGKGFAGKTLTEAYADAAKRSGLTDDEIVTYTATKRLPAAKPDGATLWDFKPEQTVEEILTYLRDTFAIDDLLRFKPDGKFHAEQPTETVSATTFYWSTPAEELGAVVTGTSTMPRILRDSWSEALSEDGFANEVVVTGIAPDGLPLVAIATDWASLNDPTAANYVGEVRRTVVIDPELQEQGAVDECCRQIWERSRRLRLRARFRALWVSTLVPGDLVTIDERGTWLVLSMATTWDAQGRAGLTQYEAEAVE